MKRSIFALWLCVVALAVVAGWTLRSVTERREIAADRRRFGAELNACGEWRACRIDGEARYCDIVRQQLRKAPTAAQGADL